MNDCKKPFEDLKGSNHNDRVLLNCRMDTFKNRNVLVLGYLYFYDSGLSHKVNRTDTIN